MTLINRPSCRGYTSAFWFLSGFGLRPSDLFHLPSFHFHRSMGTRLAARIAPCAKLGIDDMFSIRSHRDCVDRAMLSAKSAAGAMLVDLVIDKGCAFPGPAAPLQMRFVFLTEIPECRQHGVRRSLA